MTFQLNSLDQINRLRLSVYLVQRPLLRPLGNRKLSDLVGLSLLQVMRCMTFYEDMNFYPVVQGYREVVR